MDASESAELRFVLDRVRGQLEDCAVRGTRASGSEVRARMASLTEELNGLGAVRLAGRLAKLQGALGSADAPEKLMEIQTALRLVERVATLEASAGWLDDAFYRSEHERGEWDEGEEWDDDEDPADDPADDPAEDPAEEQAE